MANRPTKKVWRSVVPYPWIREAAQVGVRGKVALLKMLIVSSAQSADRWGSEEGNPSGFRPWTEGFSHGRAITVWADLELGDCLLSARKLARDFSVTPDTIRRWLVLACEEQGWSLDTVRVGDPRVHRTLPQAALDLDGEGQDRRHTKIAIPSASKNAIPKTPSRKPLGILVKVHDYSSVTAFSDPFADEGRSEGESPYQKEKSSPYQNRPPSTPSSDSTPSQEDLHKECSNEHLSSSRSPGQPTDPVRQVFEGWKTAFEKANQTKLTDKRRIAVASRLKKDGDNFTVEELLAAIQGVKHRPDDFKNHDLEWICRTGTNVERGLEAAEETLPYLPLWKRSPGVPRRPRASRESVNSQIRAAGELLKEAKRYGQDKEVARLTEVIERLYDKASAEGDGSPTF